jgi:hypothetical protein
VSRLIAAAIDPSIDDPDRFRASIGTPLIRMGGGESFFPGFFDEGGEDVSSGGAAVLIEDIHDLALAPAERLPFF